MTQQAFLNAVREIASRAPVYREGGTGADGTCDCIGLIMGAMYAGGKDKYPIHSTNYFARHETGNLDVLDSADQLKRGMLVYKARAGIADLNARYQPGGRYYTGDMLDYYHVGVVLETNPLSIVHCTSTNNVNGITYDSRIGGWTHCGMANGVTNGSVTEEPDLKIMFVTAPEGETVNMRQRPAQNAPLVIRVPIGAPVQVVERADGWCKIRYDEYTGYMMERFLTADGETENHAAAEATLHVQLPASVAEALLEALNQSITKLK